MGTSRSLPHWRKTATPCFGPPRARLALPGREHGATTGPSSPSWFRTIFYLRIERLQERLAHRKAVRQPPSSGSERRWTGATAESERPRLTRSADRRPAGPFASGSPGEGEERYFLMRVPFSEL